MTDRSSTEDLFVSENSDSDATVDLSDPLEKARTNTAFQIIISDSESDDKLDRDKNIVELATANAVPVMQRCESKSDGKSIHTVSSSDSDGEITSVEQAPDRRNPVSKQTKCILPSLSLSLPSSSDKEVTSSDENRRSASALVGITESDCNRRIADENNPGCTTADVSIMQHNGKQVKQTGSNHQAAIDRPPCKYGQQCYRKNPEHRKNFWHPGSRFAGIYFLWV
jgi:PBZ domain